MDKKTLLKKLLEVYPITDDAKYYIFRNKYRPHSSILNPLDPDFKLSDYPFNEKTLSNLFDVVLNTCPFNVIVSQSIRFKVIGKYTNLGKLLGLKKDTSRLVEVSIKHHFEDAPFNTSSSKTFQCNPEDIDSEIRLHIDKMNIKYNLFYRKTGTILEKNITEIH